MYGCVAEGSTIRVRPARVGKPSDDWVVEWLTRTEDTRNGRMITKAVKREFENEIDALIFADSLSLDNCAFFDHVENPYGQPIYTGSLHLVCDGLRLAVGDYDNRKGYLRMVQNTETLAAAFGLSNLTKVEVSGLIDGVEYRGNVFDLETARAFGQLV